MSLATYTLTEPMADELRRRACMYAKVVTGTTLTITIADRHRRLFFTNASTVNVTVPSGLPADFECELVQKGAGQIVVAAGSGAQVDSYSGWAKSLGQQARMTLAMSDEADKLWLGGDITA